MPMAKAMQTMENNTGTAAALALEVQVGHSWLKKAEMLCDLIFNATEDNDLPDDPEDDVFNLYGMAADAADNAAELVGEIEAKHSLPLSGYLMELRQFISYLLLLETKAGSCDFDRVAATGLARMLAQNLLQDLTGQAELRPIEKQAA